MSPEKVSDALRANSRALYDRGIRTFLAAANTGEYHSLSRTERIECVESCVQVLPDDATVLGGVGGSTKDGKELAMTYDDVGTDVMMITPQDHTNLHERGLLEYLEKLAETADAPIARYVRNYNPSVDFLVDLTRI